jgi:hypothetical protein
VRGGIEGIGATRAGLPSRLPLGPPSGLPARVLGRGYAAAVGPDPAVYAAVGLTFPAAFVHLWVAPAYLGSWWGYGAFFLAVAAAQGLLGVVLLRWPYSPPALIAGICGNLVVLSVYVVTRTYGIPVGPAAGLQESPGALDVAATTAEVALVFVLTMLLGGDLRRRTVNALLLLGAALWGLRLTGVLP